MKKEVDSILQRKRECFFCKTKAGLHEHHVMFGTANRSKAEKYKLKVYLCGYHHNGSQNSVHFNKNLDVMLKTLAQRVFEEQYSHEEWMREFGKNYLE